MSRRSRSSAAQQAGARAFLPKPVVAARLLDTLAEIAISGQVAPATAARIDLPVPDDVLDPAVLEELSRAWHGRWTSSGSSSANACRTRRMHRRHRAGRQSRRLGGMCATMRTRSRAWPATSGLIRLTTTSGDVMRLAEWQLSREWRQRAAGVARTPGAGSRRAGRARRGRRTRQRRELTASGQAGPLAIRRQLRFQHDGSAHARCDPSSAASGHRGQGRCPPILR